MKAKLPVLAAALLCALSAPLLRAESSAPADRAALIQRGDYLVNPAGLCSDCHTPRDEQGAFVKAHWLMGAPIGFKPLFEMPWAPAAPPIAGLPSMDEDQAVKFLTEGIRPDGSRPRPPMPEYRFSRDDAIAIVAYLKSLKK